MAQPTVTLTVQRTEWLTPHLVRVYLGDPGFDTFEPNEFTDSYVKLLFGPDDEPVMRTYTVRSVNVATREIAIDFVVHGDEGIAGPWAAAARPGESVRLRGPRGAYRPDPDADWHLLAGDESAIPAISAALEALPPEATGKVFIEVADERDEIDLDAPAGVELTWVHRGVGPEQVAAEAAGEHAPLVAAVRDAEWLPGEVQVFIHGEAETVMHALRPYIRKERGVSAAQVSISGYWRRGRTEEGFRVWKKKLAATKTR